MMPQNENPFANANNEGAVIKIQYAFNLIDEVQKDYMKGSKTENNCVFYCYPVIPNIFCN